MRLFGGTKTRLENDSNRTLSPVSLKLGELVRHRITKRVGRITLAPAIMTTNGWEYSVVNVEFEDGKRAIQVPANDFGPAFDLQWGLQ